MPAMSTTNEAIVSAIKAKIEDAQVEVSGDGRHFNLSVASSQFDGLGTLQRHRLVLSSIKELMKGESAPVHAIDSLKTIVLS